MLALRWIMALALGGFLIMFGVMKFMGAHIFPYIEYKATAAGLPFAELAYPLGSYATGALELIAGALLILPMTRRLGAMLAVPPFLGAVVAHLSPALGIATPTGFADPMPVEALSNGGPFAAADFAATETNMLFMMAAAGLVAAIINLIVQRSG